MSDFFLTEGLDEAADVAVQSDPFKVTKAVVTYARTMQLRQYEPLSPSVSVEVEVRDPDKLNAAISNAMSAARNAVRDEFARVVPAVLSKMEKDFVDDFLDSLKPEQRERVLARLGGDAEGTRNGI